MAGMNCIPSSLQSEVKTYLDITWDDTDTDAKVSLWIKNGIAYLMPKLDIHTPAEFAEDGSHKALLFEYCRYARDNALEVFETNFQSYILSVQNERKIDYEFS